MCRIRANVSILKIFRSGFKYFYYCEPVCVYVMYCCSVHLCIDVFLFLFFPLSVRHKCLRVMFCLRGASFYLRNNIILFSKRIRALKMLLP